MSVLARQARREHIVQIMRLINTGIRPGMQRAVSETVAPSAAQAGTTPGTTNDVYPDGPTIPQLGTESTVTTSPSSVTFTDDADAVSGPCRPSNATDDDHLITSLESPSAERQTIEKPKRKASAMDDRPPTAHTSHTTSSSSSSGGLAKPNDTTTQGHETPPPPDDNESASLSRIALGLRHLRSGSHAIPPDDAVFRGSTPRDMAVLVNLLRTLGRMVQAIDRSVAAAAARSTARFDRHMASSLERQVLPTAAGRGPRRFIQGQEGEEEEDEEWQTGRGKRTRWNPDADWGSERVWSEVEATQGEEEVPRRAGSRLRYVCTLGECASSPPEVPAW